MNNNNQIAHTAMILAAGLGMRMRPLTNSRPKPLVEVAGNSLIGHSFERLRSAGVQEAVVNMHYLADQIEGWARQQTGAPKITLSDERDGLLDTGGGIIHARDQLGNDPFLVLNSDSFWLDGPQPAIANLRAMWRDKDMDALLLLCPMDKTVGFYGRGDFFCDEQGHLTRRGDCDSAPFAYAGCYLVSPRLFADAPRGSFSVNLLWDRAIAQGRLYGAMLDGLWLHVGTPDAIALAEDAIRDFR